MTTSACDPELAAVLPMMPVVGIDDLPAARAGFAAMIAEQPAPDTAGVDIEDRTVPGPQGAPDVAVRIYRPQRRVALPYVRPLDVELLLLQHAAQPAVQH